MMPLQRARVAESRVRNSSLNGPRRVQSKEKLPSILQRLAHVSCRGYVGTQKCIPHGMKQGGTADRRFVLDSFFCQGFLFL